MAIIFKDGFDYLTAANLGLKWDSSPSGLSVVTGAYANGKAASIGSGNVLVAPNPNTAVGGWLVRFAGTKAGTNQAALTANGAGLTGGSSPSVAINVQSVGGDAGLAQARKALVHRSLRNQT